MDPMSQGSDLLGNAGQLDAVRIARDSLTDINADLKEIKKRRENAVNALLDFAISAYVQGTPILDIMEATGHKMEEQEVSADDVPPILRMLIGDNQIMTGNGIERFAHWLGEGTTERIQEKYRAELANEMEGEGAGPD